MRRMGMPRLTVPAVVGRGRPMVWSGLAERSRTFGKYRRNLTVDDLGRIRDSSWNKVDSGGSQSSNVLYAAK